MHEKMRPGIETQRGTVQPEIVISHPMIKRIICAVATTENTAPQTRKYVFRLMCRLQFEGFCSFSNDRSTCILV